MQMARAQWKEKLQHRHVHDKITMRNLEGKQDIDLNVSWAVFNKKICLKARS